MKKTQVAVFTLICLALAALLLVSIDAEAYPQYSQNKDATNCRACHGNFRASPYISLSDGANWGDDLHDVHRNDMLGGDCDTCHSSGPRFPVLLDDSVGGFGLAPVSCVGCHGRALDDSVANGGACTAGDCSQGAGLQQHHFNAGVNVCTNCHPSSANPTNYTPVGEDVPPEYYANPSVVHPFLPADPCDDNFIGGPTGLDNDGDGIYDGNDTDCGVTVEDCFDGADNDGDGDIDCADAECDGAVGAPTSCGVGECSSNTGNFECQGGVEVDTCDPFGGAAPDDSVCDGLDNDCDGAVDEDFVSVPTSCGVGECASTGATECVDGSVGDTCTEGTPAADDAVCDGLDNDCDGAVDEDFVSAPTSCGVGECASTGATECVDGSVGDTCTEGTPAADDAVCDGLDNDCDGAVDEDFVSAPTTCGVGECASTGATECVDGSLGDTCTEGTPAADDAVCDGLDNDCDGAVDEDFVSAPTTCGVGECASTGATECVDGSLGDTCTEGTPAADDAVCDGLDNDCDGAVDEDFVSAPTTCGVGECASTGATECVDGSVGDTCTEGTPAADDAVCDGLDNDCDGAVDEDFVSVPTSCGVGECASTGATECVDGSVGDTCTEGTPAADDAVCDGLDNDCDGAVDEDFVSAPTTCGVGECASTGATECVDGSVGDTCTEGTPVPEVCDDTLDNDCDGLTDIDDPECQSTEDCFDGSDNDGDGDIDCADIDCDGAVGAPTSCGVGECASTGNFVCQGGVEVDTCTEGTPAADDAVCDGLDNDCDGAVDEDFVSAPTTCGVGECASTGATECVDGSVGDTCTEGTPAADDAVCDGLDNDCDGAVDEDFVSAPTTCGVGECASTGATECVDGSLGDTCTEGTPVPEVCDDTLDNDCDGLTDIDDPECQSTEDCFDGSDNDGDGDIDCADIDCDGAVGAPTSCGVGECASTGNFVCQGGVEVDTCTEGTPAADDAVCDGLDNDCDGAVDEDFVSVPTSCGVGECASTGATECVDGSVGDTCTEGTPAADDAVCDGLDNDCDGAVDEDFVSVPTSCGVGECASTGATECVDGSVGDTCTEGTPAADDAVCDGLDNDCDGAVDEDFVSAPTTCGVGECASTGATECVDGSLGDTCTEGTPVPEVCDDTLDNDCDGLTDIDDPECQSTEDCFDGSDNDGDGDIDCADIDCDGAVGAPTSCGVGECASTGNFVCQGGVEVDTCTEGTPAADDAVCDGLDNDCDGAVDEDFVSAPTTCGLGECASTGATECVDGSLGDTCTEGTPAADDAVCDGLDNDCDGAVDEDFVSVPTSCGVGECASTGATECVDGSVGDTCTEGTPAADDAVCDGLDNDCDGAVDEDFVSAPTTCGLGECASTGATECVDGSLGDTCTEGTPLPEVCDDTLDNDCDGLADGDDPECVVPEVDLDIQRFKASKKARLGSRGAKPIKLTLVVANRGTVDEPRRATIIGLVDGMVVTVFDQLVSDAPGDGGMTYRATYQPTVPGNIVWQAMIFDDDPDVDAATAVTAVRR